MDKPSKRQNRSITHPGSGNQIRVSEDTSYTMIASSLSAEELAPQATPVQKPSPLIEQRKNKSEGQSPEDLTTPQSQNSREASLAGSAEIHVEDSSDEDSSEKNNVEQPNVHFNLREFLNSEQHKKRMEFFEDTRRFIAKTDNIIKALHNEIEKLETESEQAMPDSSTVTNC